MESQFVIPSAAFGGRPWTTFLNVSLLCFLKGAVIPSERIGGEGRKNWAAKIIVSFLLSRSLVGNWNLVLQEGTKEKGAFFNDGFGRCYFRF